MQKIYLAYYTGKGGWKDWIIRKVTRSRYSHVELLLEDPVEAERGTPILAISSSPRDGGVRLKKIRFDKWQLQEVEGWAPGYVVQMAKGELGKPYDWKAIFFSQLLGFRKHDRRRWFCSEFIAYALGLEAPETLSPGLLYLRIKDLNRAYLRGRFNDALR